MTRRIQFLIGASFLLGSLGLALVGGKSYANRFPTPEDETASPVPFPMVSVHLEQNARNGEVEVVFEARAGREGLAKLTVVAPNGRTVVDFTAPEASTVGMRQFRFESQEPKDLTSLKSAYPEGVYTFDGSTASGDQLYGKDTLNYQLPAKASFLHPEAEAAGVATKNLKITWTPVKNLSAYIIFIERTEDKAASITAKLPESVAEFDVPNGFLLPGTEYRLRIGTVTKEGNISFVQTSFVTTKTLSENKIFK